VLLVEWRGGQRGWFSNLERPLNLSRLYASFAEYLHSDHFLHIARHA
jgi:hypothetical protein